MAVRGGGQGQVGEEVDASDEVEGVAGAEAVPVRGQDMVIFFDWVGFWGGCDGGVAEFDQVDHNVEKEVRPVVHDLEREHHNQVPKLNLAHIPSHHSPIFKPDQEQGYLQKQALAIAQHPVNQLHCTP